MITILYIIGYISFQMQIFAKIIIEQLLDMNDFISWGDL